MSQERTLAFARTVVRFRWVVVLGGIILSGIFLTGSRDLTFSNDYRLFFGPDNPELAAEKTLEATYTNVDNVAFVIRPKEGTILTRQSLIALRGLTEAAWQVPYVIRVDSLTNYQHTRAEEDDLIVEDLVLDPDNLTPSAIDYIRSVALSEPAILNHLISEDATTTLVATILQFPDEAGGPQREVAEFVRGLAADFERENPDLEVALTGAVMLANAFQEATRHDLATLIPLMVLFLALTMIVFTRSVSGSMAALFIVGLATGVTMGLAGWLGMKLNPATGVVPVIVLTIAVADSIHILVITLREMAYGRAKRDAIIESLRINMQPVFLTSITTALGFLSLNFSDSPPFRELGNLAAFGAIAAWLLTITMLPALLCILPFKTPRQETAERKWIEMITEFSITRKKEIVVGFALASLVLAVFLPRLVINDKFVEFFAAGTEFRDDSDFVSTYLPGVYFINFSLGSGEEGGVADPAYLERLEAFAVWLEAQPEVVHVQHLAQVMKRLNRNMHGDDPAYYALPEERELAAQYLLLYEMSLPYGLDLNNQIDVGKSASRVFATVDNISTSALKNLKIRAEEWLAANAPASMQATGVSISIIFAYLTERNIYAMLTGTGIAFILISLVLVFALRNVKIGLMSLIPNITPPVIAFGVWALLVGEIGLYASVVTATALGLIVDVTVHFLSKYLRARREKGLSPEDGVRYAFSTVGSALWVSSFVLFAGFMVLAFSDFILNANLGIMTALIIVIAFVTDFLLLPAILLLIDRKERPQA